MAIALFFKESFFCPELKKSFHKGRYTPQTDEEFVALVQYAANREELVRVYKEMLSAKQDVPEPNEEEDDPDPEETALPSAVETEPESVDNSPQLQSVNVETLTEPESKKPGRGRGNK